MQFNKEQLEAVMHIDGPCLVLAGAGSGKTRVITGRIVNLIENNGISADNILAVTFTNKAATEMKERVRGELKKKAIPTISTFHSLCANILRRDISVLGYKSGFSIYQPSEAMPLIKEAMFKLSISQDFCEPRDVLYKISKYKSDNLTPEEIQPLDVLSSVARRVMPIYNELLKQNNAVDFDDLLNHVVKIFKLYPKILEKYRKQYQYILVDEFQDTNMTQYEIIRLLSAVHTNLFVVGDDDQSIYSFRGANFRNILMFDNDWQGCKTVILGKNYRSVSTVVRAASSVIAKNKERKQKSVEAYDKSHTPIEFFRAETDKQEAERIATEIEKMGRPYKKFSVLLRTNHQSKIFEDAFRKKRLPYRLVGARKFYDRKEIRDVLAYLKIIANPSDKGSILRIINTPRRGIGEDTLFKVSDFAMSNNLEFYNALLKNNQIATLTTAHKDNLNKFITLIEKYRSRFEKDGFAKNARNYIEDTGYFRFVENGKEKKETIDFRLDGISRLLEDAKDFVDETKKDNVGSFLERVSLIQDGDDEDNDDKVTVMTVHASKGLEFDTVFLAGFSEGIFPHERSTIDLSGIEEERRLCYVAITRAKKRLFISHFLERKKEGRVEKLKPSRFLKDIPEDLFKFPPSKAPEIEGKKAMDDMYALLARMKKEVAAKG